MTTWLHPPRPAPRPSLGARLFQALTIAALFCMGLIIAVLVVQTVKMIDLDRFATPLHFDCDRKGC